MVSMRLLHFLVLSPICFALPLPAFAADPTGIPECDAFLSKYEACGLQILAGGEKLAFEKTIMESVMSARASAESPATRAAIVQLCTDSDKALKTNDTPFKVCMNQ
jgi:hypothetical protein